MHAKFKNKFCNGINCPVIQPCTSGDAECLYTFTIQSLSIYICGCQSFYIFPCIYQIITCVTLEDKVMLFLTGPSGICLTSTCLVTSHIQLHVSSSGTASWFLILSCYFWLTAPEIGQSLHTILCSMTVRKDQLSFILRTNSCNSTDSTSIMVFFLFCFRIIKSSLLSFWGIVVTEYTMLKKRKLIESIIDNTIRINLGIFEKTKHGEHSNISHHIHTKF